MNIEIIIAIAAIIFVLKAVIMCSVIILLSIAIDIVRILVPPVPPGNTTVSKRINKNKKNVDKLIDKP